MDTKKPTLILSSKSLPIVKKPTLIFSPKPPGKVEFLPENRLAISNALDKAKNS